MYERFKSGEISSVAEYDEILQRRFGMKGMAGELIAHMVLDPLNLVGIGLVGLAGEIGALGKLAAKTP